MLLKTVCSLCIIVTFGTITVHAQKPTSKISQSPTSVKTNAAVSQKGIYVSRSAIALDIADREPKDTATAFPPEVKRLYCFTEIKNGANHEIQHRWYWKDELVASVNLKISSNRFRTQSAKTIIPYMTGDWRVAIVDSKDESILKMLNFVIK